MKGDYQIGEAIEHPLLGHFMVCAWRIAEVGEYYVCEIVPGIGLAVKRTNSPRFILEPV